MFDYFDRDQKTNLSERLDKPEVLTPAEQEALEHRHEAAASEPETLEAARADMADNEEKSYLRQTVYDSAYETLLDEDRER